MKDCGDHYEFITTYVDDLLIMAENPMALIKELEKQYKLKGVGFPVYYLGGNVDRVEIDGKTTIATHAKTNITRICEK